MFLIGNSVPGYDTGVNRKIEDPTHDALHSVRPILADKQAECACTTEVRSGQVAEWCCNVFEVKAKSVGVESKSLLICRCHLTSTVFLGKTQVVPLPIWLASV